jgi:8-oxo-dGTP pyrophosphatase MutT (NUDIX family)
MPMSDYVRGVRAKVGHDLLIAPAVTGLVFDEAGRVLLVRHSNGGVWVAPGGAVEPDEAPVDAVVREVWEETGLHVEPVGLAGVFGGPEFRVRYTNGDETAYVMAVFECRVLAGRPKADGEETLDARFFAPAELATLRLSRWAEKVLPELVARRGQTWVPVPTWSPPDARP